MTSIQAPPAHSISVGGLTFRYLQWGPAGAPSLLLLHGLGSNAHAWDHFASRASARLNVIALDQRGHGDTGWATDGYRPDAFVQDFAGIVEGLGVQRFALVGHSMGGITAIGYAAAQLQNVERLVIVDIGPRIKQAGVNRIAQGQTRDEFDSIDDVFAEMRSQDPAPPDHMLRHRAQFAVKRLPSGRFGWKADPMLRDPHRGFATPPSGEIWQQLEAIQCPTLIVRGETSDLLEQDTAEEMAKVMRDARLVVVPRAGHRVPLDNFDGFCQAVEPFLSS